MVVGRGTARNPDSRAVWLRHRWVAVRQSFPSLGPAFLVSEIPKVRSCGSEWDLSLERAGTASIFYWSFRMAP